MSDETETYERDWEPFSIADGECHIPDLIEHYERYDAVATAFIDGHLWVLPKGSNKWVNVIDINEVKTGKVSAFPGGRASGPKRTS